MDRIYLDANATTPAAPEVVEAMLPFFHDRFGNPSSAHAAGQRTRSAVEHARAAVAALLHAEPKSIVFTSGGTESNNLALSGVLQPFLDRREPTHLITSQIEHHAVLYAAEALERRGREAKAKFAVTFLAPTSDGVIHPAALEAALRPETRMVSIMFANNETGVIQPIGKLARIAKAFNASMVFHTDAVQAAGKIPIDLTGELKNIDLLTLSGHKLYGPQGSGALFIRKGTQLAPLFHGGPQERQRRAGTENVPAIVGLGRAAELARIYLACYPGAVFNAEGSHHNASRSTWRDELDFTKPSAPQTLAALRNYLETRILTEVPNTRVNAATSPRVPNTTNILFAGIDAEALLIALDIQGIASSFGAACQSGATEPSHVLLAMGLTRKEAASSLRFSLLRSSNFEQIDEAATRIIAAVRRLQTISTR